MKLKILDKNNSLVGFIREKLSSYDGLVVVLDCNLAPTIEAKFPDLYAFLNEVCVFVPKANGEDLKSFQVYMEAVNYCNEKKLNRKSAIIAIGGGSLIDLAGFLASTYMRGIDYYIIPTTFLSMIDAAIGGKNAINVGRVKNVIGSFYEPKSIFIDVSFLETLPKKEFRSGMGELIKYGLLSGSGFFEKLELLPAKFPFEPSVLKFMVRYCCKYKLALTQKDFFDDKGLRFVLNLGHTFGHALESVSKHFYSHGEAVGMGLFLAVLYSHKKGFLSDDVVCRTEQLLKKYAFPLSLDSGLSAKELVFKMTQDKKSREGVINLVLLKGLAEPFLYPCNNLDEIEGLWKQVGAK